MTSFPGAIYAGSGRSLDRRRPDLTLGKLVSYPHRRVVRREPGAEVMRVWALNNDATIEAVSELIQTEALDIMWSGVAILLLAQTPEPLLYVADGLLAIVRVGELLQRQTVAA